jgi:hypothetical protein
MGTWPGFEGNPFVVLSRLNSGSVPVSTMALMAGLSPVVVLMCIVLAITIVLFAFAAISHEKRYLAIITSETDLAPAMELGASQQRGSAQSGSSWGDSLPPPHTTRRAGPCLGRRAAGRRTWRFPEHAEP